VREGQELENPKTVAEIGVDLKLSCNRVPQMAGQGTFPAREVLEKQTGKELGKYHLPQKNEGLSWAFVQPLYLSQGSCPSSRGPITSAPAKLIHSPKLIHLMKEAGGISCCPVPSPCLLSWFHGVHLCPRSTLSPIAGVLIVEHSRI
jgi:hypothetical protein